MPRDRMHAERSRRRHRAQHGRTGHAHRPALSNTDRSQPDGGTEHSQPDGRAEHGPDRAEPDAEQLGQRIRCQSHLVVVRTRRPGPPRNNPAGYAVSRAPARARPSAAAANWRPRAVDAYAKGAAFDGAVRAAERQGVFTEAASVRWADLQRRADDLTEALYAMRETAPTEHRRVQVENAILSLRAVRDAMDAQRSPGDASSQQGGVLHSRLSALESSLNALRVPDDPLA
jgi:hypothetical protein